MQITHENYFFLDVPENWNVPRGTNEKLLTFYTLLQKWNSHINLISKDSISPEVFIERHVMDSLQLKQYTQPDETLCDIGSGAGFPAIILAAAGHNNLHLVESDKRKCEFLKEAARQINAAVTIHNTRAETLTSEDTNGTPDVITARALAEIGDILTLSRNIASKQTRYVLLKGASAHDELEKALENWRFDVELKDSHTDNRGKIVILNNVMSRGS